jgi:hypothetical protein
MTRPALVLWQVMHAIALVSDIDAKTAYCANKYTSINITRFSSASRVLWLLVFAIAMLSAVEETTALCKRHLLLTWYVWPALVLLLGHRAIAVR